MHAVNLIARALPKAEAPFPEPIGEGLCAVTGLYGPVVRRKDLLGVSFTDGALLLAPDSPYVSVDSYRTLKYKWERMSSWACNGQVFQRLDRVGVRNAVLATEKPDIWCGYATTSYKKHGAMRAPVNSGERAVWLFETRLVDCSDRFRLFDWWIELNRALRKGFGRPILETLDCPGHVMAKVEVHEWMAFEQWARPKRQSALYAFLCYLLPSQEELKNERV